MKKTNNYDINIPELGDIPDITIVGNSINSIEKICSSTPEYVNAVISGNKLLITSKQRDVNRTSYYDGMSFIFIAKNNILTGSVSYVSVDGMSEQSISIESNIYANELVVISYRNSKFNIEYQHVKKSDSIALDSSDSVASSKAVKTAYDRAVESIVNTANSKVSKSGDTMTGHLRMAGSSLILNIPATAGSFSRGVYFNTSDGATNIGGIGAYGSDTSANKIDRFSIGFGSTWSDENTGLTIMENTIKFNGNPIYHTGNKPTINDICPYRVGDILATTLSTNPATTWIGTTWQKIEGRYLKGTSGSEASKVTGGSNTKTISIDNLPSHNHQASQSSHLHTQATHRHLMFANEAGSGSVITSSTVQIKKQSASRVTSDRDDYAMIGTSTEATVGRTNAGGGDNTGSATPTITVGSTGGGTALNIEPAYYTVHYWIRTA